MVSKTFKGTSGAWSFKDPALSDGTYIVVSDSITVLIAPPVKKGKAEANAKMAAASKDLYTALGMTLQILDQAQIERPQFAIDALNKAL